MKATELSEAASRLFSCCQEMIDAWNGAVGAEEFGSSPALRCTKDTADSAQVFGAPWEQAVPRGAVALPVTGSHPGDGARAVFWGGGGLQGLQDGLRTSSFCQCLSGLFSPLLCNEGNLERDCKYHIPACSDVCVCMKLHLRGFCLGLPEQDLPFPLASIDQSCTELASIPALLTPTCALRGTSGSVPSWTAG